MLYSNKDFENFYVRYKAEDLPRNLTVKTFCLHNKVQWNVFDKWYSDTRHRIAPLTIAGRLDYKDTKESEPEWIEEHPKPGSLACLEKHSVATEKRVDMSEKRAEEESSARFRAENKIKELMKTIETMKDIHRIVRCLTRQSPISTPSGNR